MRKVAPLIVSGSSAIGKTAFASRLVKEHPNLFKISSIDQQSSITQEVKQAEEENKIPIFETSQVSVANDFSSVLGGSANSLFIMPPNIQSLRAVLERNEVHSQNTIDRTCENIQTEVSQAYKSSIFGNEDFIIHNNDFESAYQQFKKRVFFFYQ